MAASKQTDGIDFSEDAKLSFETSAEVQVSWITHLPALPGGGGG
jgi:hypothetical protein